MMKQGVMFAMSLLALGCGGAPAAGPANVAVGVGGWAPTLAVSAADIGGVLGFARLTDRDAVGMMPQGEGAVVVWPVRAGVAVDSLARTTTLLGPSGDPVRGQLGAPTTIPHGCDGGTIEVVPITPEGRPGDRRRRGVGAARAAADRLGAGPRSRSSPARPPPAARPGPPGR
jgi:hypothetical protein